MLLVVPVVPVVSFRDWVIEKILFTTSHSTLRAGFGTSSQMRLLLDAGCGIMCGRDVRSRRHENLSG